MDRELLSDKKQSLEPQGSNIDGLVQDCSNSSANALELLQSCAKPLIYQYIIQYTVWNQQTHIHIGIYSEIQYNFTSMNMQQINPGYFLKCLSDYQTLHHGTL